MKAFSYTSLGALTSLFIAAQGLEWDEYACMTSTGDMKKLGSYTYNSPGMCQTQCEKENGYFFALQAEGCWCGSEPPAFASMNGATCDEDCPGWPEETCGGNGTYSVWDLTEDYSNPSLEQTTSTEASTTTSASSASVSSVMSSAAPSVSASVTSSSAIPSGSNSTASSAVPTTTLTSGASRRFRFLFF
ncbi:hypothetical protein BO94DRAFT_540616 [Aspergillus sclerotioniger CBS 115572]|uniref:WSC domain-containing protein n=1 Tax=Aspergillus sclerotioniger CBS 115572 TaxID=1450535 RepID=A0A317UXL6_9EURO|nr:hypothetical protein BO94DRAFT_540616 [Aspergillus sclerotioniger CBS 115572]PWY66485.1 hypothetical protein BO94DRAFT_540616 [Aspergillus sclerotioniger CBS 115572]